MMTPCATAAQSIASSPVSENEDNKENEKPKEPELPEIDPLVKRLQEAEQALNQPDAIMEPGMVISSLALLHLTICF